MRGGEQKYGRIVRAYTIVAILIAALIGGWAISASILSSHQLLIHDVQVDGLHYLQRTDVLKRAGLGTPKSTLRVHGDEVTARLLASPWIHSVQLRRPRRDALRIQIQEAVPRLIVATPQLVLVDAQGQVIDDVVPMYDNLPLLTGAFRVRPVDASGASTSANHRGLSHGLGGAIDDDRGETVLDTEVIQEAVHLVDRWQDLDLRGEWPIGEIGWDSSEGFTVWVGGHVQVMLGHRHFRERMRRAHAVLSVNDAHIARLVRVDVRPSARAVMRFSNAGLTARKESADE